MEILASLAVAIGAETSGLQRGIAIAKKELRGLVNFGASLQDLGKSLSIGLTAPLGLVAGAAVVAAGELDGLRRGLSLYVGDGQKLQAELSKLKEVAKLPGLGLKEAIQGSTNLQAAGFSADFARRALVAFGGALASVGKGKQELDRVSLALTQINNTPFVQGQDLNQLRQALPQIGAVMQKVFGVTTVEALKAAGVSSKQFIEGVTAEFEKLPKATGGLKNSLENLSDASTIALDAVGSALDRVFNVQGAADGVYNLATGFAALPPAAQETAVALGAVAAGIGPVLLGIGGLAKITPLLVNGFALLVSPVGLVVAGLAALGIGTVLAIGKLKAMDAAIQSQAKSFVDTGAALTPLLSRYDELKAKTTLTAAEQDELARVTGQIGGLLPGVATKLDQYGQAAEISKARIKALREEQERQLVSSAANKAVLDTYLGLIFGIGSTVETTKNKLAGLRKELADLKPARDFATSRTASTPTEAEGYAKAINAYEAVKKKIRELISAEGESVGPKLAAAAATEKQTETSKALLDALTSLQTQLLENQRLINNYGVLTEHGADRSELLAKGIDTLISKGFNPAGAVVQKYIKELRTLNETLRQNIDLTALQGSAVSLAPVKFAAVPTTVSEYKPTEYDNALRKSFEDADKILFAFEDRLRAFQANAGQIVGAGFADMATAVGVGVGNLAAGLSGVESIPQILLGIVGDMAINLGKAAIGIGTAMAAIKLSFTNPFSAIAAGVALVALGTAIKGVAGGIVSGGGGGGGGYSAPSVGGYQSPQPRTTASPIAQTAITHRVELTARGDQLIGALSLATDRFGRVTGR